MKKIESNLSVLFLIFDFTIMAIIIFSILIIYILTCFFPLELLEAGCMR
jgi:hypothetical protein